MDTCRPPPFLEDARSNLQRKDTYAKAFRKTPTTVRTENIVIAIFYFSSIFLSPAQNNKDYLYCCSTNMARVLGFLLFALSYVASAYHLPQRSKVASIAWNKSPPLMVSHAGTIAASAALALLLTTTEPAWASSSSAAQIHLNSLPPSTISVQIGDLPVVGNLLSGTYAKTNTPTTAASVVIKSPSDKVGAIKNAASGGHFEFDVDGLISTHLNVDVAATKAGEATVRVTSPLIPALPFKNSASGFDGKFVGNNGPSKTAAKVSFTSLPPTSIDVEIGDLPVVGGLLSGVYTKVDSVPAGSSAAITIESPKDKFSAIKAASGGHLEFDVDGVLSTHLDVDIAADKAGVATVKVKSPLIPSLPFKNTASL